MTQVLKLHIMRQDWILRTPINAIEFRVTELAFQQEVKRAGKETGRPKIERSIYVFGLVFSNVFRIETWRFTLMSEGVSNCFVEIVENLISLTLRNAFRPTFHNFAATDSE